jgi:hypothetical protein
MTPTEEEYVAKHLGGTGQYTSVTVGNRLLGSNAALVLNALPSAGADALLSQYVRTRLLPHVTFAEVCSVPSPTPGYPADNGEKPLLRKYPPGVLYLFIGEKMRRAIPGSRVHESIPALAAAGDPVTLGPHHVLLDEPAPGDVPCSPACRTAEQAFASVRGRVDLVLRYVLR